MALEKDGKISLQELERAPGVPSYERLKQGACAILECTQRIPCNPCEKACPSGAIKIGHPITNLPILDDSKCSGCEQCIPSCPGLAIFVVDLDYNEQMSRISIPYELLPVPKKGNKIVIIGRGGEKLCESRVLNVRNPQRYNHTAVISFLVPREYAMRARHIKLKNRGLK